MAALAMGIAALRKAFPAASLLVKFSGAIYLAWMGLGMLRAAHRAWRRRAAVETQEVQQRAPDPHPFSTALLISLMNPKAIFAAWYASQRGYCRMDVHERKIACCQ